MDKILRLIGRNQLLFTNDIKQHYESLEFVVSRSAFLVIGGAGSIGQAVVKEIFKRHPKKLHVVDLSENNSTQTIDYSVELFGKISEKF